MRECPTCRRRYNDDLRFCLEDGTPLVDEPEMPTQFAAAPAPRSKRGSRMTSYLMVGLLVLVGGGFLLAAGVGGYMVYRLRSEENVFPAPSATPSYSPGPAKADNSPAPAPSRSSTPPPFGKTSPEPAPTMDTSPVIDPSKEEGKKPPVPKQISGGVLNGKATSLPKPAYPPAARAVNASGTVVVQVLVDEDGNVASASAVSGHPLLRAAAVEAARSAKFAPTKLAGQPVKVSGIVTYRFAP